MMRRLLLATALIGLVGPAWAQPPMASLPVMIQGVQNQVFVDSLSDPEVPGVLIYFDRAEHEDKGPNAQVRIIAPQPIVLSSHRPMTGTVFPLDTSPRPSLTGYFQIDRIVDTQHSVLIYVVSDLKDMPSHFRHDSMYTIPFTMDR